MGGGLILPPPFVDNRVFALLRVSRTTFGVVWWWAASWEFRRSEEPSAC